jgi:hypothetical protein
VQDKERRMKEGGKMDDNGKNYESELYKKGGRLLDRSNPDV